jgi:hypothetical protein
VRTRVGSPLRQWLLTVAIALGVVAMHHVVAGPAGMSGMEHHDAMHSSAMPTAVVPAAMVTVVPAAVTLTAASVTSPSAQMATDPGCPDCGAMMGHMCLAVLLAAATLIVGLALFTIAGAGNGPPRPASARGDAFPARAPPDSAVRLSQLGVLRR